TICASFTLPLPPALAPLPSPTLFRSSIEDRRPRRARRVQVRGRRVDPGDLEGEVCEARWSPAPHALASGAVCRRRVGRDTIAPQIGRATSELQSRFDLVCRLLLEKIK